MLRSILSAFSLLLLAFTASLHAALTREAEAASKPLSQLIVEKLAAF